MTNAKESTITISKTPIRIISVGRYDPALKAWVQVVAEEEMQQQNAGKTQKEAGR